MNDAICAICGSSIPCVVTAGVPMRRPLVTNGLRGSLGTVFLFIVMPASSRVIWADLAGQLGVERLQVDDHQVVVGAARDEAEPLPHQRLGERRRVRHDLVRVLLERRVRRLAERDGLAGDHVLERAALPSREHGLVDRRAVLRLAHDAPAARTAQRLVRGERDDVGVRHRVRVGAADDQPGDVRGVEQEQRSDFVGDRPERLRIDPTGVRRGSGDDHLRVVLEGEVADLVHVDALVAGRHLVGDEPVEQPAGIDRRAVREVAAVVEAQAEHGVARLEQRLVGAHVGVGAGVRLHVGVLGVEQRLDAIDGERLDLVDDALPP